MILTNLGKAVFGGGGVGGGGRERGMEKGELVGLLF